MHYIYVRPNTDKSSLICSTEPNKNSNEENQKKRDAQKKRSSHKAVYSQSWGQEGSLWWKRFVKEVGFEPIVKERGSYGW